MRLVLCGILGIAGAITTGCGRSSEGGSGGGGGGGFIPAAPAGITTYSECTRITVRWPAVTGATSYTLYRATVPGVTPQNYASLAGGARVADVTSPHTVISLVRGTTYYFVLTASAGGNEGPPSAQFSDTTGIPTVTPLGVQGTLRSLAGTLSDLVLDPVRNRVYATNQSSGQLEIFDIDSGSFLAPLPLGSLPAGMDIAPDLTKLFICMLGTGEIKTVDVTVQPPAVVGTTTVAADAAGAKNPRWIGCAGNGKAFFTCQDAGAGYAILRELDLTTMTISLRTDLGGGQTRDPTFIGPSGDRSRLVFAAGGSSSDYFVYTAASDEFSGMGALSAGSPVTGAAANMDGSLLAVGQGPCFVDPSLRQRGMVVMLDCDFFVFSPTGPLGYGGDNSLLYMNFVDVNRLRIAFQIQIPAAVTGRMRVSPDGNSLFAIANGGILQVPLDINIPPRFTSSAGMLVVNPGETATYIHQAEDVNGDSIELCADSLPANATFDPATGRLTFAPSAAQEGQTFTVTLYASDTMNASSVSVTLVAQGPVGGTLFRHINVPSAVGGGVGDMAYDPLTDRLYATATGANRVEVVHVGTSSRLVPIPVGCAPKGLDLNASGTRLVVCPSGSEYIQVVDLTADPPAVSTFAVPDGPAPDSRFPRNVGVAANGRALFTTGYSGNSYLREVNLGGPGISVRGDTPGGTIPATTVVRASRDRSRLFIGPLGVAAPPFFAYDSAADAFGTPVTLAASAGDVDVNADGTRVLMSSGPRVFDGSLALLGTVSGASSYSCFRQGTTLGYRAFMGAISFEEINTVTFSATGITLWPGNQVYGRMITNSAGTRLIVIVNNGLSIITLP